MAVAGSPLHARASAALKIIDLSAAAAQPMINAAATVAVTFNGGIYNHHVIRAELEKLGKYMWSD